ncbi:MAG: hypothetical protein CVU00_11610, partial [Bacteroidetes bacterium HGW-Bacteroidetes-17]
MAGVKETPRQRMIAMMYLVLTALLAINVSKEVIDAFLVVNESIELTNEKFSQRLQSTYGTFEKMYQLNQHEVKPYWDKAREAKSLSEKMIEFISSLRYELISITEKIPIDSAKTIEIRNLKNKDNYSLTTAYFMGDSHDGSQGKSRYLKEKIIEHRQKMVELINPKDRNDLKLGLITDSTYFNADGQRQNWEAHHFYNTILAADITILNKIITEVYDAEFEIVNKLMDEINAEDFSYDKIDAKVLPDNNYIFVGDEYTAEVIVAAYDTSQSPEIYLMRDVDSLPISELSKAELINSIDGKSDIRLPARKTGINKYAGVIGVKTSTGETNYYHFSNQYIVAQPSITISVAEMNVLYIGVENTVSISVSGISKENLHPVISKGTITAGLSSDKWTVTVPPNERNTVITITAIINGTKKEMGSQNFRIRRLP